MKEKLFLLLLLLCGVLVSCDKNTGIGGEYPESGIDSKLEKEGEENSESNDDGDEEFILGGPQPDFAGYLHDGADIDKLFFYCWNKKPGKVYDLCEEDNPRKTRTLEDYSHMELRLEMLEDSNDKSYHNEYPVSEHQIWDYCQEKTRFLYQEYQKYREQYKLSWPSFYSAYVNGKVTLTCDKKLFGKEAGEDLSDYFRVHTPALCMPVGIESPHLLYSFCDKLPTCMNEFFLEESWIQSYYFLDIPISPEEKYSELTFHITMPIKKESARRSMVSKANGTVDSEIMTEEVYESDCLIKFNW